MKFAIYPHEGDYVQGDAERTYREFIHPLREIFYREDISLLEVSPSPLVSDSIRLMGDGQVEVRLFNPSDKNIDAKVASGDIEQVTRVRRHGLSEVYIKNPQS